MAVRGEREVHGVREVQVVRDVRDHQQVAQPRD